MQINHDIIKDHPCMRMHTNQPFSDGIPPVATKFLLSTKLRSYVLGSLKAIAMQVSAETNMASGPFATTATVYTVLCY